MPSVTYMNQSAPFWDFIASLEQQGANRSSSFREDNNENAEGHRAEEHGTNQQGNPFDPWGFANFFGGREFPHRGPPPHQHDEANLNEKDGEENKGKDNENGEGPSGGNSGSDNEGGHHRRGHCGRGRRRGHCGAGGPGNVNGPWGPHHRGRSPWGAHHPHHHHHGGPRGWGRRGGGGGVDGCWGGPWTRNHPFAAAFDPSTFMNFFSEHLNPTTTDTNTPANTQDHTPDADVFDTESAYVVHISLPGAKKEDVGVNWDPEKSELSIAGVIYRPGDEDFLKTLAMDERKVGPFERKIRLGTRATPAHVDAEGITAKLEDGVLRVEVQKLDAGYVEVKKVDIE